MTTDTERSGLVVEVHGILATVGFGDARDGATHGERVRCRLPRERERVTPVVGDRVTVLFVPGDEPRISAILPRRRVFARLTPTGPAPIAASVDRLVIVTAAHPGPRPGLIDRMAIACDPAVPIMLVFNKDDVPDAAAARALLADHEALGWTVFPTSAATGAGVDALRAALSEGISVLVGHSGVGKSTLVNRLAPGARLLTGDVNDQTGKGRHTTTVTTVHPIAPAGLVVDTPGVRAFPLEGMELTQIAERFPGLGEAGARCHFAGCLHEGEPGCAVADAVADGTIPAARVARWHGLLAALREEAADAPARARRAKYATDRAVTKGQAARGAPETAGRSSRGTKSKGPPPRQRR